MAALDSRRKSLIENESARFSIWTSNTNIFAVGQASIDHRLRSASSVQRLVLRLLEVLHGDVEQCMCIVVSSSTGRNFFS
jgi:hypothetical protein